MSGRIILVPSIKRLLYSHRQLKPRQPEAGGLLLGQIQGEDTIVTRATMPNIMDRATRRSFHRDPIVAQILMDYEFANSQGRTTYLGEWHTHPEAKPKPSSVDIAMIEDQFSTNSFNVASLLMIIVGTKSNYALTFDGKVRKEVRLFFERS